MAEVFGTFVSAVTIAALFKSCLDAFDLVQAARHQEIDYQRLLVRFNIEKCRLYTWGQAMRLTDDQQTDEPRPLDTFLFKEIVVQTLRTLHGMFNDSQKLKEQYGCQESAILAIEGAVDVAPTNYLAAAFSHFQNESLGSTKLSLAQRARWVIRDKKKFAELIQQIKELVDGLQEITKSISPVGFQASVMVNRIVTIADIDTLQVVSEACEQDHSVIARAASLRSEVLSMSDTRRAEIEAWLADEIPLCDPEIADIENMDISELKRCMLLLMKERQRYNADPELLSAMARSNKDSKIITLLTMLYLPATFVASLLWHGYN